MASVLVPLAQGCEELEAVTVIDLLRRADITVTTAGLDTENVTTSRGVVLIPDTDLYTALQQDYEMIVLPCGLPGRRPPRLMTPGCVHALSPWLHQGTSLPQFALPPRYLPVQGSSEIEKRQVIPVS